MKGRPATSAGKCSQSTDSDKSVSPRRIILKELSATSVKFSGKNHPINLQEQKEQFFRYGVTPKFVFNQRSTCKTNVSDAIADGSCLQKHQIRTDFFKEAKAILDKVKEEYGDGSHYIKLAFGETISFEEAMESLEKYIIDHGLHQEMTVYWAPNLTASAKMMWTGPHLRYNKPEARRWSLVVQKSTDNIYLSKYGIKCLADHEIGTHYFRMYNDGFQPWFASRQTFHLRGHNCRVTISTEEGLAAINTVLNARKKYLYKPALLYYTACKARDMTFSELFAHMGRYVTDQELRFKLVMRVKRSLPDINMLGGNAHDQCYFEGAIEILQNIDNLDFKLLYSGRVCADEVQRIKRLARMDAIRYPNFLTNLNAYIHMLKHIAYVNGLSAELPLLKRPRRAKSKQDGKSASGHSKTSSSPMCLIFDDKPIHFVIYSNTNIAQPAEFPSLPIFDDARPSTSSLHSSTSSQHPSLRPCCGGGPVYMQPTTYQKNLRLLARPKTQQNTSLVPKSPRRISLNTNFRNLHA